MSTSSIRVLFVEHHEASTKQYLIRIDLDSHASILFEHFRRVYETIKFDDHAQVH